MTDPNPVIQTDLQGRALAVDGKPISGLYAVGEAAGFGGGGIHGHGSLEGTFLGGCVLTARAAARGASSASSLSCRSTSRIASSSSATGSISRASRASTGLTPLPPRPRSRAPRAAARDDGRRPRASDPERAVLGCLQVAPTGVVRVSRRVHRKQADLGSRRPGLPVGALEPPLP